MPELRPRTRIVGITVLLLVSLAYSLDASRLYRHGQFPIFPAAAAMGLALVGMVFLFESRYGTSEKRPSTQALVAVTMSVHVLGSIAFIQPDKAMYFLAASILFAITLYLHLPHEGFLKRGFFHAATRAAVILVLALSGSLVISALPILIYQILEIGTLAGFGIQTLTIATLISVPLAVSYIFVRTIFFNALSSNRMKDKHYRRIERWIALRVPSKGLREDEFRNRIQKICDEEREKGKDVRGFQAYIKKNAYKRIFETKKT